MSDKAEEVITSALSSSSRAMADLHKKEKRRALRTKRSARYDGDEWIYYDYYYLEEEQIDNLLSEVEESKNSLIQLLDKLSTEEHSLEVETPDHYYYEEDTTDKRVDRTQPSEISNTDSEPYEVDIVYYYYENDDNNGEKYYFEEEEEEEETSGNEINEEDYEEDIYYYYYSDESSRKLRGMRKTKAVGCEDDIQEADSTQFVSDMKTSGGQETVDDGVGEVNIYYYYDDEDEDGKDPNNDALPDDGNPVVGGNEFVEEEIDYYYYDDEDEKEEADPNNNDSTNEVTTGAGAGGGGGTEEEEIVYYYYDEDEVGDNINIPTIPDVKEEDDTEEEEVDYVYYYYDEDGEDKTGAVVNQDPSKVSEEGGGENEEIEYYIYYDEDGNEEEDADDYYDYGGAKRSENEVGTARNQEVVPATDAEDDVTDGEVYYIYEDEDTDETGQDEEIYYLYSDEDLYPSVRNGIAPIDPSDLLVDGDNEDEEDDAEIEEYDYYYYYEDDDEPDVTAEKTGEIMYNDVLLQGKSCPGYLKKQENAHRHEVKFTFVSETKVVALDDFISSISKELMDRVAENMLSCKEKVESRRLSQAHGGIFLVHYPETEEITQVSTCHPVFGPSNSCVVFKGTLMLISDRTITSKEKIKAQINVRDFFDGLAAETVEKTTILSSQYLGPEIRGDKKAVYARPTEHIIVVISIFSLVIALLFVIYRRYVSRKKANDRRVTFTFSN